MYENFVVKIGSYCILRAIFLILFGIICLFIDIINAIIWIHFIISQKRFILAFISAEFFVSSRKFFCFLLLIVWIFIRGIIFFFANKTLFCPWLTAILFVLVPIIYIVLFVLLVSAILLLKSTICIILNNSSFADIVVKIYDQSLEKNSSNVVVKVNNPNLRWDTPHHLLWWTAISWFLSM